MSRHISENPSDLRQERKKVASNRDNGKSRVNPASREQWAKVLATADKYY